jgi:predicted outer membrane repeat protein
VIHSGGMSVTVDIGPGQTVDVYVQVTVPPGTYATIESDDSTKEFTSLSFDAVQCTGTPPPGTPPPGYNSESDTSNSAVTRVAPYRNFIIVPDNFGVALPGQTVTYTHIISNVGNMADTYEIIPKSGFYALAEIAEPGSGQVTLNPLESATVVISVTINPEAAGGLIDISSAIASSTGDPSLEKAAANNTTISYTTGTRYVSLTGQDKDNNCTQPDVAACRTIQHAIDQAASNDMIKIDHGIYTDVLTVTHMGQVIPQIAFADESVILQGGYDRNNWDESPPNHTSHATTLDPQGLGRVLYVVDGISVTVDRLVIRNGDATGLGGGPAGEDAGGDIYNEGADLTLNANRIYDGAADHGGGLYHGGGDLLMQNNLLHGNTVVTAGGAAYVYSGTVILQNNTFHDNQAGGDGGAVYVGAGNLTVTSTIFANNVSGGGAIHGSPATASMAYNLYYNNTVSDTGGTLPAPSTPPDVRANPQFVGPGSTPPNLHLQKTSPAREAGDPATNTSLIPYDHENNPRMLGYLVDIGAYEYVIEPGVELEPDHDTLTSQGVTIIYTHTLTNTGDLTDTFDLAYSSSQGWGVLLTSSPITLPPDITATVEVSVVVPPEGVGGLVDLTVVATDDDRLRHRRQHHHGRDVPRRRA